jgi:hypothetical protein
LQNSQNSVESPIWTTTTTMLTRPARESSASFLRTLPKRLDTMTLTIPSQSGNKLSGTSQSGLVLHHKPAEEPQHVTTKLPEDGQLKNTLHKTTFNILEEVHSSFHGTTITEPSQKCLLRASTIAECTSLTIQISCTLMPSQYSHQRYGST